MAPFLSGPPALPASVSEAAQYRCANRSFGPRFLAIAPGGLPSEVVLAPTAGPAAGGTALQFVPTSAIVKGMAVSGADIQPGTLVRADPTTTAAATSVPLSMPVGPGGVAF